MKCLVLAGGYDQIELIQELKSRNIKVILLDYLENPPAKEYADVYYRESTLDLNKVKKIALEENIDLITTACTDQALLTMAKVSEDLGLPCYISYETALNVTNKSYMKKKMLENGIPTANYVVLEKSDITKLTNLKLPLVIKPVDCNSSKGVIKVEGLVDIEGFITNALNLSRTKTVIVEEYKEGIELSVDIYVKDKIVHILLITETVKVNSSDKFTIIQSKYPANIDNEIVIRIKKIAEMISEAFNIDNGPLLVQLITNGNDINVLEFSARMGGGTKCELIHMLSGVDIMKLYVNLILDNEVIINYSREKVIAQLNYCYCKPGIFDKLHYFEELKKSGIIFKYFQYKTSGMRILYSETSADRVAGYLIIGETNYEIQEKQNIINKNINIIGEDGSNLMLEYIGIKESLK